MPKLALVSAIVAALAISPAAEATGPVTKWSWTASQAERLVLQKVRIPFCRVFPNENDCANGRPIPGSHGTRGGYRVASASCVGTDEIGSSFRFPRFSCEVVTAQYPRQGHIAVYVTGPTTFRWKII